MPLPRVSLYLPRRLTAAQCSAAAVCAARIRSPYGRYLGQVSDCTCPSRLARVCSILLLLPGNPAWPPGWLAWPGVSLAARCCLSSLSLTLFPFPTAVGHFEKREHTACLASMACLEAAAYWNSRTLLSPSLPLLPPPPPASLSLSSPPLGPGRGESASPREAAGWAGWAG